MLKLLIKNFGRAFNKKTIKGRRRNVPNYRAPRVLQHWREEHTFRNDGNDGQEGKEEPRQSHKLEFDTSIENWVIPSTIFTLFVSHHFDQSKKLQNFESEERPRKCTCCPRRFINQLIQNGILYTMPSKLNIFPERNAVQQLFLGASKLIKNVSIEKDQVYQNDWLDRTSKDSVTDRVTEICENLKSTTKSYQNELNNMIGVLLVQNGMAEEGKNYLSTSTECAKAMFNLGVIYESGQHDIANNQPDYDKAFTYYQTAASLGNKFAFYNLSLFYLYGKGSVEVDNDFANYLLERAAEKGVKAAQDYCVEHKNSIIKTNGRINALKNEIYKNYDGTIEKDHKSTDTNQKQQNSLHSSSSAPNLSIFASIVESFQSLFLAKEKWKEITHSDIDLSDKLDSSPLTLPISVIPVQ